MTTRPRLVRSVPFGVLVVGSAAAAGVGLWLTIDKLRIMTNTLADGSATGVEVYVGQSWAVLGSILIGAGLVGLALALTVAAAASLVKRDDPIVVLADDDADVQGEPEIGPAPESAAESTAQTSAVTDVSADEAARRS